jgi:thioesterase domain-containing protein
MTDPSCPGEPPGCGTSVLAPTSTEIERYLHARVPLTAAMGVTVRAASAGRVELAAPITPNINDIETVFGGSAVAVAILAAWTLLYVRQRSAGSCTTLMIQRSLMSYEHPITGDFEAVCELTDESSYERFASTLRRHGRARITLHSVLVQNAARVASFEGDFVALREGSRAPQ